MNTSIRLRSERLPFLIRPCVRSVRILSLQYGVGSTQHGHIHIRECFFVTLFLLLILDCKANSFSLFCHTKAPFVMSSHVKKPPWYKSVLYSHVGSYISQLSFSSLTFPTHYAIPFPCRVIILKVFYERLYLIMKWKYSATFFYYTILSYLSTALFRSSRFSQARRGSHPRFLR